jgi:predicted transcriptional regulator
MAEQMKKVQKKENRTRSELLREAWRQYFESHYGSYTPTKAELLAIRAGRIEIKRGEYRALQEILNDLDHPRRKTGRKTAGKSPH